MVSITSIRTSQVHANEGVISKSTGGEIFVSLTQI